MPARSLFEILPPALPRNLTISIFSVAESSTGSLFKGRQGNYRDSADTSEVMTHGTHVFSHHQQLGALVVCKIRRRDVGMNPNDVHTRETLSQICVLTYFGGSHLHMDALHSGQKGQKRTPKSTSRTTSQRTWKPSAAASGLLARIARRSS